MASKRDYYEILGVDKKADAKTIKAAYRKLALQYHPDRNKAPDAEAKFKEINEAYQVLSDEKKRQMYDQFGHAAFDPSSGMGAGNPFAGGFAGQNPFTWSYTNSADAANFDFGDPFEIFEQFFGGGFRQGKRRAHYSLHIDFMEAVNGTEKTLEIEGKKHTVKIPAGANDGTRIRFDDFDVTLDVGTHSRFKRDGYDIFVDEAISYPEAVLGTQLIVQTLDKELKLKIRPGTQPNTLIRLRGEGVPLLRHHGRGDFYVRILLKVPETVSRKAKKLLQDLDEELQEVKQ